MSHEPYLDCTCGVYAAKNIEHLRQLGYEGRGIRGEVHLWGTVVEHELGWRAQFAYPKTLFLPPHLIPSDTKEMEARLGPSPPMTSTSLCSAADGRFPSAGRDRASTGRGWTI